MQRDFIGYGNHLPKIIWPNEAKIAVNFVINYEEGSESNILDGDYESESYISDLPNAVALKNQRHLSIESLFEYGSRRGIWRLLNLFDLYNIPTTIFATGLSLEKNPPLVASLKSSSHEIAGHGYRWINYRGMEEAKEKKHIQKTIQIIESLCQKKVSGWYTGRKSANTRKLVIDEGLLYDSDSYADDIPYWIKDYNKPHLIIPYQLDTNDFRYTTSPGWASGDDYYHYLKASFECLYAEGSSFPKMMTIGLHPRVSGRPGRVMAINRFIKFLKEHDKVWLCRRVDIAEHFYKHHKDETYV